MNTPAPKMNTGNPPKTSGPKRFVTQEELDKLVASPDDHKNNTESPKEQESNETDGVNRWNLAPISIAGDSLGIHLRQNRTGVAYISKKKGQQTATLQYGYDQIDKLAIELQKTLSSIAATGIATKVVMSGKAASSSIVKLPVLHKPQLIKALRLQLRQSRDKEDDDLEFIQLPSVQKSQNEYLAATITQNTRDKVCQLLRKLRLKIIAWDSDILCYARAISFHLASEKIDGCRFGFILDSDQCHMCILGTDGRLVWSSLPLGITSFLEHIATTLGEPTVNPKWLEESEFQIKPADPMEVRQKKIMVSQAIHTLYVPFAQQVRMQLYVLCSENNLPLPKAFVALGPGAEVFRIAENLELDLGLKLLPMADPESAVAFGASLWDTHELRMNLLPRGKGEYLRIAREFLQTTRDKMSKARAKKSTSLAMPSLPSLSSIKALPAIIAVVLLVIAYPAWRRVSVSRKLNKLKTELSSLEKEKENLAIQKARQELLDKKTALLKTITKKSQKISSIIKPVLYGLPPQIRLNFLSIREGVIIMKGTAQSQTDFEKLLEDFSALPQFTEPVPGNLRRENDHTQFEITMKVKT